MSMQTDDPAGLVTLQKVYGKSIPEIEQKWKDWIKAQPLDYNVALVQLALVMTEEQWQRWLNANKDSLYWSEQEQIYRVKD